MPAASSEHGSEIQELAGYKLLHVRSKGKVGTLYVAEGPRDQAALVRKVSTELSDEQLKRVDGDLEILEEITGANLARLVAHGEHEGQTFYALEDPGGTTLLDLVRSCRPLDEAELVWIGRSLSKALATLHLAHLPHGNLVPANVAITPRGAFIVDLGWSPRLKGGEGPTTAQDLRALGELLTFSTCGVRPPPPPKAFEVAKRVPWLSASVSGILQSLLGPPETRPAARDVAKQLEVIALEMNLPVAAPLPSLEALLLKLPDRRRSSVSRGGSSGDGAQSESNWDLQGGIVLQPGSAILLRPGLELLCERMLGQGGMGVVYLLRDPTLGRLAALKLVRGKNDTRIRRFLRETNVTARLDHPGIPPVYEAGRTPTGDDYLLMRYVEGNSMRELLDRMEKKGKRPEDVRNLIGVMVKVGEALGYAHSRGIVHRDLKPDNIMIGSHGEVFVMDWGLARNLNESAQEDARVSADFAEQAKLAATSKQKLTHDRAFLGTPGYLPPEQFRREEVDGRADVFAMGAVLSEILTGRNPFPEGDMVELMAATNEGRVELPAERDRRVAPELNAIVGKALNANRAYRYTSADALVSDLRAYLEGREVSVYRPSATRQIVRFLGRHYLMLGAQAVFVLLMLGAGALAIQAKTQAEAAEERAAAAQERMEQAKRESQANLDADEAKRRVEVNGLVAAGQRALADGDAELAKEYFVKALALSPEHLDARVGKREADEKLEAAQTEGLRARDLDEARRLVKKGQQALEREDLATARRAFLQALGFDGSNTKAQEGLIEVDRRGRESSEGDRKRKRNVKARSLLRSARADVEKCHELIKRQQDPREVQDRYLNALGKLQKALQIAPNYPAAERLRVTAAHELHAVLTEEGQHELAGFVLRMQDVEAPETALKLERDPYLQVVESERVKIRRAFPGAVHFKPTTIFDELRDYLERLGKGRFFVSIEVRAELTDTIPPNILSTALWVRLEDRKVKSISPPLKIPFERAFRRMITIDRHRRIVAPFDQGSPAEARRYARIVEERVKAMMKEAINRNQ